MSRVIYYNLHDILKFKINTNSKLNLLRDINFFFSYFESEPYDDSDIILNIGRFTPCNENCTLVDHKYWIKDNYFYCKDSDGRAKWEVEILGFEHGKATINFNSKILGIEQILIPDYLAQNVILRPLIELKLLEKGYVSVHGLGIEKEGNAYILAARGGAHKTRIAMDLMRNSRYRLIGDDRIILGKEHVLSYPLFFNLVRFKAENMNDEHVSNFLDKLKMLKYLNLRKFCGGENKIIAEKSKLSKLFLVARRCGEKISINEISVQDAVARITSNSKMEMMTSGISSSLSFIPFFRYMLAYSYVFPESKIAKYFEELKQKLETILKDFLIYEITLPEKYSDRIFNTVLNNSNQIAIAI